MFNILFVCTGKSGRSQMAAAFSRIFVPDEVIIFSAGNQRHKLDEYAVRVMKELDMDIPGQIENDLHDVINLQFDLVVTMCDKAREVCPTLPGSPARIHWPLPDPGDNIESFRVIRDEIQNRVISLFQLGFIDSIKEMRTLFGSLLNNLTDGVMAHDLDRRIIFFNKAAEEITGYNWSDVIGQDCHEVFLGRFCGGNCSFCDDKTPMDSMYRYQRQFTRKNREKRMLEMSVMTIKPPNDKILGAMIIFRDVTEVNHLRKRLEDSRGFNGIIGRHPSMAKLYKSIQELADVKVPILIQGETGTGKELVAHALHQLSSRSSGPFVPVNCGALPEGTLESELFGHVKGAFTGSIRDRKGRFELAEGGTIFLDEIGEISPTMQVKLLRVLQENSFVPVGSEKSIEASVRVLCATNRDLKLLTQQGLFREDLYYRLAVVPINLPCLRERKSDIKLLAEHFLDKYSADTGKKVRDISPEALDLLKSYNWPGNVRELCNAVQYGMIKCNNSDGVLESKHLPPEIHEYGGLSKAKPGRPSKIDSDSILETLKITGGNKAKAARLLGISRTTLYRLTPKNM